MIAESSPEDKPTASRPWRAKVVICRSRSASASAFVLADGLNKTQACKSVGIGVSTLADWVKRYPGLSERMDEAREQARQKMLSIIKSAAEKGDYKAASE